MLSVMRIESIHTAAIAGVILCSSAAAESRDWERQPLATVIAAADKGDKRAQLELGKRYEAGLGVPVDTSRAVQLYSAASRSTPKQTFIYSPPLRRGGAGRVVPLQDPQGDAGLPEAAQRLQVLKQKTFQGEIRLNQPHAVPAKMTALAPTIKLVEPPSGAIASFFLPQVPKARVDVLAANSKKGTATGLFKISINGKELYEHVEARCNKAKYRYIGDGSSVEEALRYRDDQFFAKFAQWDIKYPYIQYLCEKSIFVK